MIRRFTDSQNGDEPGFTRLLSAAGVQRVTELDFDYRFHEPVHTAAPAIISLAEEA